MDKAEASADGDGRENAGGHDTAYAHCNRISVKFYRREERNSAHDTLSPAARFADPTSAHPHGSFDSDSSMRKSHG
jgi:hypothetical protein